MEKKSSIIAIGLTVHQTPVHIREQLSIAEVHPPAAALLACTRKAPRQGPDLCWLAG